MRNFLAIFLLFTSFLFVRALTIAHLPSTILRHSIPARLCRLPPQGRKNLLHHYSPHNILTTVQPQLCQLAANRHYRAVPL